MIKNKLVSTRLLMSVGFILSVQHSHAVRLSIDNLSPLDLSNDINFDLSSEVIEFSSSDPVICRNLSGSSNDLNAEIIDPNGDGQIMPVLQDISYNLSTQIVNAKINNVDGVCVTDKGSNYGDLIFSNGFGVIPPATFKLEGLGDQIIRGQSLDYIIRVENDGNTPMNFDLVEYVSKNPVTQAAFFESVDEWECVNHNNAGVDCNEDDIDNQLLNASIPGGGFVEIDVSRTVGPASTVGQPVDFLTAVFIKNGQGDIVDVKVLSQQATVIDNNAPVLSWVGGLNLGFTEDGSQSQSLSFNVIDNTGVNLTPAYLATAIGAVNDKLIIDNINVTEDLPGEYTVSFDVLPKPNQFTSVGNTEQIFIQIEDDFNASSNLLMLSVAIDPINDAPSFMPTCLDFTINPTPVGGETEITCNVSNGVSRANWNYSNLIDEISAGGVANDTEASQSVIFEILPVSGLADQDSVIVTMDPGTFILNDLMLILSDGVSGEGRFRIRALDNGTPNGEIDVCPALAPTDHCSTSEFSQEIVFNVMAPIYFVSGTIDDLPQDDQLIIRLFEAGTATPLGGNMPIDGVGVNGNQPVEFTYDESLGNGVIYDVAITLQPDNRICAITAGATGIINNANMNDLVIDCN